MDHIFSGMKGRPKYICQRCYPEQSQFKISGIVFEKKLLASIKESKMDTAGGSGDLWGDVCEIFFQLRV